MIEIIRKELKACGKNGKRTRYRVAQETGVLENQLHRVVNGGSLSAETASVLLEYFGYEVRKKGGQRK